MMNPVATLVCFALLAIGVVVFRRCTKRRWSDALFALLLSASLLLYLLHAIADRFTGAGLNEAAWYHIRFGLTGAGLAEHVGTMVVAALAIVASLCGAYFVPTIRRRHGTSHPVIRLAAFALVGASLAVNPGAKELVTLALEGRFESHDGFDQHYRRPELVPTREVPRNLVFIYAEGLEQTFLDEKLFPGLAPGLRRLQAQSTWFSDIHQVYGAGHTIAGIVASQCGVPLASPFMGNRMGGVDQFLPGAIGLGDLLHREGYYLSYYGGADLRFAGKGTFFRTHKFDEVLGRWELISRMAEPDYLNTWGLYDDTLFDLAFLRFEELAETNERFGLFLLTLETHQPDGHISRTNAGLRYGDGSNSLLNAVASSDRLITAFVDRIRSSPHGANTVVVIASDHLALPNTATAMLERGRRRNLFMVLEPPHEAPSTREVNRRGSTLDTGATLLPFLGFRTDIGLGRDLLDPNLDEDEIARIQDRNNLVAWRDDIDRFWHFPVIRRELLVDVPRQRIFLDGRVYSFPVLIRFRPDGGTSLSFSYSRDGSDRVLIDELREAETPMPFILIDRSDNAVALTTNAPKHAWCVFFGHGSTVHHIEAVERMKRWSRAEIDALLPAH